jgi:hypothetical protein
MRKLLYILAIMLLFVPAVSLAQSTNATPTVLPTVLPTVPPALPPTLPVVPGTVPDSGLYLLDAAMNDLALAVNSHNSSEINQYVAIAQQKLAAATAGRDDLQASLKASVKDDKLKATLKIKAEYPANETLKISAKVKQNKHGLYNIDIRIKGDVTDQQKACLQALVEKAKLQMPGVNINLKFSDAKKGNHHCEKAGDH